MLETHRTSDEPFAGPQPSVCIEHEAPYKNFVWGEATVEGNRSFPNKQSREYA